MNKGISKWPARALNLLVVLAMVISLSAILVAPPIAAAQETCNPTPEYNGCHLEVAVNTYIKDADGNFIPEDTFLPDLGEDSCFYVNAVVVNTGNDTAIAPINATISFLDGGVALHPGEGGAYSKYWAGNLTYAAPDGLIADFWWKVCCTVANGWDTIRVNATAAQRCDQLCPAFGQTEVYQGTTEENKCLNVQIVEAPGMPDYQGILGNYHMTVPGVVNPCTNFGIKAEITNNCPGLLTGVKGTISWGSGPASIVGNDPLDWLIGDLAPGQTKAVGWTLHCDDPGDVNITVTSSTHSGIVSPDYWTVHQAAPGGLAVRITQPVPADDCTYTEQPIKQPYSLGACASASNFTVKALVTNTGDSEVINIYAIASATPATGWVSITSPIFPPFALLAGASREVTYAMRCIGVGDGNITVNASGSDLGSGLPVVATPDVAEIAQLDAIAQVSPATDAGAIATPDEVNKCQDFYVTFRYTNYTATGWNVDGIHGNITACIYWDGPAELTGKVQYRRIVGGLAESWQDLNLNPTGNESVGDCENLIQVICPCCATEVRWHFKCIDAGTCIEDKDVTFYSTLTVDQNTPALYHREDTSESVCVEQVWKAHLTSDVFFFIQEEDTGRMILQNAIVPGTDFHVVIPVINTGDATAQNVQVYFTVVDDPTGDCIKSYTFVDSSGDGTVSFNTQTGVGIASLGDIPGGEMKKAVLLLHCNCEGHVSVYIPDLVPAWGDVKGVRGFDENTGAAILQANISTPPCPRVLEQIPFTVVIENPYNCQTFNEGVTFPVKAKITNGSILDLDDVSATLTIIGPALLVETQSLTKLVGNITAGSFDEITWELVCTGGGEVYLTVSATLPSPMLTAISDTVNVHQVGIPNADIHVTILSPDEHQQGQDWDVGRKHAMIATGQEFAVSAKIDNEGPNAATNVTVTIDPYNCDSLHYVTLADGQLETISLGTIPAGNFTVVTWTLWGGGGHDWNFAGCDVVEDTICVNATSEVTDLSLSNNADDVEVSIYPAAFLIATIDNITPASPFVVCEEFVVDYTVTNYGVADAWNTSVTLSVNPDGSVRIAEGEGGYTQYLGTIAGWSWGSPFNSVDGSFTLHCKQLCESTLTITPAGDDECGWHAVLGEDCYGEPDNGGDWWECEPQYNWVQFAGLPIQSRFIIPASQTVKQVVSKPITGDMTQYDISLASGWNLISLPLIPNSTAIATVLAGVAGKTSIVWAYDAATVSWTSWVPGVGGDLTAMADGKGYWINMNSAGTLTINGVELKPAPYTPKSYPVVTGWNLIGFKSTTARTAGDYLAAIAGDWTRMYTYGSAKYSAVGSDDMMNPGKGYWIAVTAAGTIYP